MNLIPDHIRKSRLLTVSWLTSVFMPLVTLFMSTPAKIVGITIQLTAFIIYYRSVKKKYPNIFK